jgi:hypothetical protein
MKKTDMKADIKQQQAETAMKEAETKAKIKAEQKSNT